MLRQDWIRRAAIAPLCGLAVGALALRAGAASPAYVPNVQERTRQADVLALRAGTIHCVQNGQVFEGGATILIRGGKILAVGKDIDIPAHAELVDYGPDAVVVPGLVAPYSEYGSGQPSRRSASPGTRALDNFNPFYEYALGLSAGVTSAYITPSEARLISGVGALVKLGGGDPESRVLNAQAAIHCSLDSLSRNTPGYWDPPLPVNAESELGYAKPQLPATTMGAVVALSELVSAAREAGLVPAAVEEFGAYAISDLAPLMQAGVPWRISAETEAEIRAALRFAREHKLPLILEKVLEGKHVAKDIAEAGVPVIYRVPFSPNQGSRDQGTGPDARWPEFDIPAALVTAGVRLAIACEDPRDLLFSAALVTRGGLSPEAALRAITLTPAELSGAGDRVGSIQAGKDADLCVLNAAPFSGYASVLATWVDGQLAWKTAPRESVITVIEVEELYVGDGEVLRPGQLLIRDGRIAEVAERVSHPIGANVVRAKGAMPGMIDAFGHLGLEGSRSTPAIDFDMTTIISPGDAVDRRVAAHGITTVVMTPRSASRDGAPVVAYKPAAADFDTQVVGKLAALRLNWGEANAQQSGAAVKALLERAKEYGAKWEAYHKALAEWTPPKEAPEESAEAEKETDEKGAEEKEADEKKVGEEEKPETPDPKKSKKKKKDEEVIEPDPISGLWTATIQSEGEKESAQTFKMRLYFKDAGGSGQVTGNLRSTQISRDLVQVLGQWDRAAKSLSLNGLGSNGWVNLKALHKDNKFEGSISSGELELKFTAERTVKEDVSADRSERRRQETPKESSPKGKPKEPSRDTKLEPYLSAMRGELTVVIEVNREDAILDCVSTFEAYGIKPVLFGATDAHHVAAAISGRVAGVLLDSMIRRYEAKSGTSFRTPYGDLQAQGILVAFHSGAEEGAIDLPIIAAYAVANGMSPEGALRALTSDAALMMSIADRVGRLKRGLDADVLLLDGAPLAPGTSVLRTWVAGKEVR